MSTHSHVEEHCVMTAVGPDRVGVVREVSAALHREGCNLEDSRMAVLAGEFALILLFSGDAAAVARAREQLSSLLTERMGFQLSFRETSMTPHAPPMPLRLRVTGPDQPGIVSAIGEILAAQDANVVSFESRLSHAAFSGTPIFSVRAELRVPSSTVRTALEAALRDTCERLQLDFEFDPSG